MPDQHHAEIACPTCGPNVLEPHPRIEGATRCANCKTWRRDFEQPAAESGLSLIYFERLRQIESEGYSREHDLAHGSAHLSRAARCYEVPQTGPGAPDDWPWGPEFWKPRDIVSNLVRAGALYQAALEVAPPLGQDAPVARSGYERCRTALDQILAYTTPPESRTP